MSTSRRDLPKFGQRHENLRTSARHLRAQAEAMGDEIANFTHAIVERALREGWEDKQVLDGLRMVEHLEHEKHDLLTDARLVEMRIMAI